VSKRQWNAETALTEHHAARDTSPSFWLEV
jgi:hypothetical protein